MGRPTKTMATQIVERIINMDTSFSRQAVKLMLHQRGERRSTKKKMMVRTADPATLAHEACKSGDSMWLGRSCNRLMGWAVLGRDMIPSYFEELIRFPSV